MKIIISPAKKMKTDPESLATVGRPIFLEETSKLLGYLRKLSYEELKTIWKCNDQLARENMDRVKEMQLDRNLTAAIISYEGIQYQYMAPGVMEDADLAYISEHLRILSGFYGIVRPMDGVVPYRLEMQAKLPTGKHKAPAPNLYAFWGDRIAKSLEAETDVILNLASGEYAKAVLPHLSANVRLVNVFFGEYETKGKLAGKLVEKGTYAKMARGEMVRYLANQRIDTLEGVKGFGELGYRFSKEESDHGRFVFIKEN